MVAEGLPRKSASQRGAGIRTFGSKLSLGTTHLMNDGQRASEHGREMGNSPKG